MLCNRLLYAPHVIAPLEITMVYQMAGSFLLLKGVHTLGRSETGLLAYSPNHLQIIVFEMVLLLFSRVAPSPKMALASLRCPLAAPLGASETRSPRRMSGAALLLHASSISSQMAAPPVFIINC